MARISASDGPLTSVPSPAAHPESVARRDNPATRSGTPSPLSGKIVLVTVSNSSMSYDQAAPRVF
jgi:hypothetical protein